MPELRQIPNSKPDHEARCFGTQEGGWLVDTDWRHDAGSLVELEAIKAEIADLPPEVKRAESAKEEK